MYLRFSLVAFAVAASLPTAASAVDFSYSGFSTAAYSQSDTNLADVGYVSQPDSIDKGGSFETDSKIGVQLTAKFNHLLSATVQGVAYTDLTGDFEPHLDWAYARLQATQSLSLRAGYLRAPTFMYSDSVFVGYANVWVRPPLEVYNLSPVYQLRGVDATYRTQLGAFTVSVNPYFGEGEAETEQETIDVKDWVGVAATVTRGSLEVRAGYGYLTLDSSSTGADALIDPLRAIPGSMCGVCSSEADRLMVDGSKIGNLNVGVQYDDGKNFVATEYARSFVEGGEYFMPDRYAGYVTYGRRFGNLMPYATVAGLRRQTPTSSSIDIPALSAGVNAVLNSTGANDQDSYSVGVRYELPSFSIVKGALVKFQFDHIDAESLGNLNNVRPGFDGKVDMVSASFDVIF